MKNNSRTFCVHYSEADSESFITFLQRAAQGLNQSILHLKSSVAFFSFFPDSHLSPPSIIW